MKYNIGELIRVRGLPEISLIVLFKYHSMYIVLPSDYHHGGYRLYRDGDYMKPPINLRGYTDHYLDKRFNGKK